MNRLLTPGSAILAGAALCAAASNASAQGCTYQGNGSPQWERSLHLMARAGLAPAVEPLNDRALLFP